MLLCNREHIAVHNLDLLYINNNNQPQLSPQQRSTNNTNRSHNIWIYYTEYSVVCYTNFSHESLHVKYGLYVSSDKEVAQEVSADEASAAERILTFPLDAITLRQLIVHILTGCSRGGASIPSRVKGQPHCRHMP